MPRTYRRTLGLVGLMAFSHRYPTPLDPHPPTPAERAKSWIPTIARRLPFIGRSFSARCEWRAWPNGCPRPSLTATFGPGPSAPGSTQLSASNRSRAAPVRCWSRGERMPASGACLAGCARIEMQRRADTSSLFLSLSHTHTHTHTHSAWLQSVCAGPKRCRMQWPAPATRPRWRRSRSPGRKTGEAISSARRLLSSGKDARAGFTTACASLVKMWAALRGGWSGCSPS
jgi:hypothetical protein